MCSRLPTRTGRRPRLSAMLKELGSAARACRACIGTRPDCLDEEKMRLMASAPWREFWLGRGRADVQRRHASARESRAHGAGFGRALRLAARFGVKTCAHLMAGLPGEDGEDFFEVGALAFGPARGRGEAAQSVRAEGRGRGTGVEERRAAPARSGGIRAFGRRGALTLAAVERRDSQACADPAPGELVAPAWAADKRRTLDMIDAVLAYNDWWQGKDCDAPERNPFLD